MTTFLFLNQKNMFNSINRIQRLNIFHVKIRFIHKQSPPWRITFYGSDNFSLHTLKILNENRLGANGPCIVECLDVICPSEKNLINKYAMQSKLNVKYWPYVLPKDRYDVGVVVSFGHLIQTESIDACTYGMINAHPSLLPRWRGAAPIVHTILNGDEMTGVTILQISPNKFDRGKVLLQECSPVPPSCTSNTLQLQLGQRAAEMVLLTLQNLPNLLRESKPQPKTGGTHAFKIDKSMGILHWNKMTCTHIDRRFRALDDFIALFSKWEDKTIKFKGFTVVSGEDPLHKDASPGFCYFDKNSKLLHVKCQDGWVGFEWVQLSGRKLMSALDFHNGFLSKREERFWYLDR